LELYVAAGPLINKHIPINYDDRKGMEEAVASLEREVNQWTEETASFIKTNLGPAAQDRFLDVSNMPIYTWNPNIEGYDQIMNALANRRKNLSLLIETSAYDR
jgi:hypothetical protein